MFGPTMYVRERMTAVGLDPPEPTSRLARASRCRLGGGGTCPLRTEKTDHRSHMGASMLRKVRSKH
eukprot:2563585-Pyramimonas_sp.AAC.1